LTEKGRKASFFRYFARFPESPDRSNEQRMPQSRHPSSRRRPDEKKEVVEDAFVDKTLEVVRWSKANAQILLLGAIVVVVVFAGLFYYRSYRASVREQAVAQLEQVQGIVAFGERETAKAELYQYLDRFEGTPYALEARLMLGQVLLETDAPEEAVEVLAPAVRVMDKEPLGIQAAFLMAAAYEELDRVDEAERVLLRIARAAELSFQVREALATAARLRTAAGNFAGAAQLFEEILGTLEENDPDRSYWEMRLAEVSFRS
jgi:predicted negative regulator of RcsB-dependent stress response